MFVVTIYLYSKVHRMYSFYEKSVGGIPNHCSTSITRLCLFLSSLIEFSLLTLKIYCYRLKEHYCTIFIFKKNAATCMSTGSLHYSCRKFSFFLYMITNNAIIINGSILLETVFDFSD